MDERTREKLAKNVCDFLNDLLKTADEENYDRDSFVKAAAEMFLMMVEISTFQTFEN